MLSIKAVAQTAFISQCTSLAPGDPNDTGQYGPHHTDALPLHPRRSTVD